jgi:hypothetical protein
MTMFPSDMQLLISAATVVIVIAVVAVGKFVIWWVTRD